MHTESSDFLGGLRPVRHSVDVVCSSAVHFAIFFKYFEIFLVWLHYVNYVMFEMEEKSVYICM